MKYRRGLNRVYCVLCVIWFLAWLVGFPLYTRSKDLRDTEFFVQYIYIPTTFEAESQPKPLEPTPEEIERTKQLVERQESFLKENPHLAQELERENRQVQREIAEEVARYTESFLQLKLTTSDPFVREQLHRIYGRRTDLARNQELRVAQEQAGLFNTYKQLWKSNWRGWGLYVLLGLLVAYAVIYGFILTVQWVMQGFHKS
jgi:hypothetical protein